MKLVFSEENGSRGLTTTDIFSYGVFVYKVPQVQTRQNYYHVSEFDSNICRIGIEDGGETGRRYQTYYRLLI